MADEATSSAIFLMLATCGLSLAALACLFHKHVGGEALLAYQPRRRVPWGPLAVCVAMAMPLLGVAGFCIGSADGIGDTAGVGHTDWAGDTGPAAEQVSTESLLITGWGNFTFMILFVMAGLAWLVTFFRADAHDLGLPTSWKQLTHDVRLGFFAVVAAILPIYAVQLTLINILQSDTKHPLVEQLEQHNSPQMLLLSFAMAVIAAPLFEEFTFRGLLQGWLERREDEILGFAGTERQRRPLTDAAQRAAADGSGNEIDDVRVSVFDAAALAEVRTAGLPIPAAAVRPSQGWIPDLPHGWTPILLSGAAFGLAHIGHGVAPVSLVLFGVVLGYLYQRTHRLVPSITAHMLFNSYSLLLLWLQLEAPIAS